MTTTVAADSGFNSAQFSHPLTGRVFPALFCSPWSYSASVCCWKFDLVTKRETLGGGRTTEQSISWSFKGCNCLTTDIIWIKLINVLDTLPISPRSEGGKFFPTFISWYCKHGIVTLKKRKWYFSICGLISDFFCYIFGVLFQPWIFFLLLFLSWPSFSPSQSKQVWLETSLSYSSDCFKWELPNRS